MFLVGAYQEILGDLHNLFGDTDAVHVRLGDDGRYEVEHVVEGDTVTEVLHYVQYDKGTLIEKVRRTAIRLCRLVRLRAEARARLARLRRSRPHDPVLKHLDRVLGASP